MNRHNIKETISDPKRIKYLNKDCQELHITKAFSKKDLEKIINKCKRLKTLTLANSAKNRLGVATKELLKKNNIRTYTKKEQGRAIEIKMEKLAKIVEMYKDHSYRELEEILKIPKSTIHYLIKYSKRKKIKDGKKIVYLK